MLVVPGLVRLVGVLHENLACAVVVEGTLDISAAFEDQDALAAWREPLRERGPAWAGANHDDVVAGLHLSVQCPSTPDLRNRRRPTGQRR